MLVSTLLFFLAIGVILGGAAVFTNGVEWLGRRLGLSDGAIGSILAGVATALPETLIPVIAIFWGTTTSSADIGLGAILGAPLMLSTITIPLLAGFLLVLARMRRRTGKFELDYRDVRLDLGFFLAAYGVALLCTLLPAAQCVSASGALIMHMCLRKIIATEGMSGDHRLYFSPEHIPAPYSRQSGDAGHGCSSRRAQFVLW